MINEEVMEKLAKILALASCKGATQGEVEAAMARAREIAMKHGIALASVPKLEHKPGKRMEVEQNTTLKTATRFRHPYDNWILATLQDCFDVKVLSSSYRVGTHVCIGTIWIIGEQTDVAVACAIFPWLESMFPKVFGELVKQGKLTRRFADQNGCYLGLYRGIKEANKRVQEQLKTEDRSKWALVLVDKQALIQSFMEEQHPNVKEASKDRREYSARGLHEGEKRGRQINLKQTGNGSSAAPAAANKGIAG